MLNVPRYRWAKEVKAFAGIRCIFCGSEERPEAHHVKPQSLYPDESLNIENGVVLCHDCHRRLHFGHWDEIQKAAEDEIAQTIRIVVPKGQKATVETAAKDAGESVNQYAQKAILARMGLEKWPENKASPEEEGAEDE